MSRIHEAIRKAAVEQQAATAANMSSSVESILSTSYAVGTAMPLRTTRTDILKKLGFGSSLLQSVTPAEWMPDKTTMLFFGDETENPAREQFRSLRTRLYELRNQRELCVVAVASSLSGEGKSFVAANLAHTLALQRERTVLLVDGDLRRGSLSTLLGTRPRPGLSEYLQQQDTLAAVLQRWTGGNLYLIPSGGRIADPGELIGGAQMSAMLSELRPLFDWIVIDTPPAAQFADAGMLADLCDGALLVVGAGLTPVTIAKKVVSSLREDRIIGVVLNRGEDSNRTSKYFSYYTDGGK